jgi:hypothetical protein
MLLYVVSPFSGDPVTWNGIALQIFFAIGSPSLFILFVVLLRSKHESAIYVTWLLFSFGFFIGIIMGYFNPDERGVADGVVISNYKATLHNILSYITEIINIRSEIVILLAVFGFITAPQILAYILSGLFGCAARPLFISKLTEWCVLSFVKTFTCYAGFGTGYIGSLILCWNAVLPLSQIKYIASFVQFTPLTFVAMETTLALIPFGILCSYYYLREITLDEMPVIVAAVHNFMTRYRRRVV